MMSLRQTVNDYTVCDLCLVDASFPRKLTFPE